MNHFYRSITYVYEWKNWLQNKHGIEALKYIFQAQQQAVSSVVVSTQYMDFKDVDALMPKQQKIAVFTPSLPAPGPLQPGDAAGPIAGWNIQSFWNCMHQ